MAHLMSLLCPAGVWSLAITLPLLGIASYQTEYLGFTTKFTAFGFADTIGLVG